jgi:hypothetical protein
MDIARVLGAGGVHGEPVLREDEPARGRRGTPHVFHLPESPMEETLRTTNTMNDFTRNSGVA